MKHNEIKTALDRRFRDDVCSEAHIRHVLLATKGGTQLKRKVPLIAICLLMAMLAIGVAVAATMGVFGRFAQQEGDRQLQSLDTYAQDYSDQTVNIAEDGAFPAASFSLDQAYYDGSALYVAYVLSTPWMPATFLSAADVLQDMFAAQNERPGTPYFDYILSPEDIAQIEATFKKEGCVYFEAQYQNIGDVEVIANGTVVEGTRCNLLRQPDGSHIGYAEYAFPLPEAVQNQDVLELVFILNRGGFQYYQDETGAYMRDLVEYESHIELPITVQRGASTKMYASYDAFDAYTVQATLSVSALGINTNITVLDSTGDEGMNDGSINVALPYAYQLYAGDIPCELLSSAGIYHNSNHLELTAIYALPDDDAVLTLVPSFYGVSGEKVEERIAPLQLAQQ